MKSYNLSITEALQKFQMNELSPIDLLESLFQRIRVIEPRVKAWVSIDKERAMETAVRYSKEIEEGTQRGPLHGIPIGVKDIFYTKGIGTAAGSSILSNFIPNYDATTIARLKEAGAIILGKTETTEFAYSDPAPTRNPWNTDHSPGGSSSGSAAAVSSGMCPAALGSQTGGSTIRPASYCGIVGIKPTYGRISRYGMIPRSWSMDHVGILTRTVEDTAIMLEVIAGHDSKDSMSSTTPVPRYRRALKKIDPPRLGFLREFFYDNAQNEIRNNIDRVVEQFTETGASVVEAQLPKSFSVVHAAQSIIGTTEGAAYHNERFKTRLMDYRLKMRGLIGSGLLVPASTYLKAQRIRGLFIQEIKAILKSYDCFIMPSASTPAPKGLESTGSSAFNSPWSFCGFPSITFPSGLTKGGLPMGIQLVGRPFEEERLLGIARWCEKIINFNNRPRNILPHCP